MHGPCPPARHLEATVFLSFCGFAVDSALRSGSGQGAGCCPVFLSTAGTGLVGTPASGEAWWVSRQPVLAVSRGAEPTRYAGSPPFSMRHLSAVTCSPEMLRGKIPKSTILKSPGMGISPLSGVHTPRTPPPLVTEGPCGGQTGRCGHSVFTAPPLLLNHRPKVQAE